MIPKAFGAVLDFSKESLNLLIAASVPMVVIIRLDRIIQNLSLNNPLTPFTKGDSEGFPTSGNDGLTYQTLEQSSL
ncbi:MAG: hypothetical protein IBX72_09320 [Nitrospirae bacterium]|nr:hypothetical protein [Nitrospirota bacterium]